MGKYVFGVDVGGTTVKLGLFDVQGTVKDKWEIPTVTTDNGVNIIPDIAESILAKMQAEGIEKSDVVGIGMGVPGPVKADGTVIKAVNLGWGVFNPNTQLSELVGVPAKTGNDANVAALGEMWKGGGQGYQDMVAVTLGTGVGGGIILGGRIVAGSNGAGGEIGHIHLEDNETDQCGCKGYGCLEQYASATGIVRLAKKALAASDKPSVLRDSEVTAKSVWDAVKDHRDRVRDIFEDVCGGIGSWTNDYEMAHKTASLRDALNVFEREFIDYQRPLVMQPIWKTQGQTPLLSDEAFDIVVWSNLAFSRLFIENEIKETMSRPMRATARMARCIWELSRSGRVRMEDIYRQMTFGQQNDKEANPAGKGWRKYISTDRVLHPVVPKTAIREILAPNYTEMLKPERRLDQTLYYDALFTAGNE